MSKASVRKSPVKKTKGAKQAAVGVHMGGNEPDSGFPTEAMRQIAEHLDPGNAPALARALPKGTPDSVFTDLKQGVREKMGEKNFVGSLNYYKRRWYEHGGYERINAKHPLWNDQRIDIKYSRTTVHDPVQEKTNVIHRIYTGIRCTPNPTYMFLWKIEWQFEVSDTEHGLTRAWFRHCPDRYKDELRRYALWSLRHFTYWGGAYRQTMLDSFKLLMDPSSNVSGTGTGTSTGNVNTHGNLIDISDIDLSDNDSDSDSKKIDDWVWSLDRGSSKTKSPRNLDLSEDPSKDPSWNLRKWDTPQGKDRTVHEESIYKAHPIWDDETIRVEYSRKPEQSHRGTTIFTYRIKTRIHGDADARLYATWLTEWIFEEEKHVSTRMWFKYCPNWYKDELRRYALWSLRHFTNWGGAHRQTMLDSLQSALLRRKLKVQDGDWRLSEYQLDEELSDADEESNSNPDNWTINGNKPWWNDSRLKNTNANGSNNINPNTGQTSRAPALNNRNNAQPPNVRNTNVINNNTSLAEIPYESMFLSSHEVAQSFRRQCQEAFKQNEYVPSTYAPASFQFRLPAGGGLLKLTCVGDETTLYHRFQKDSIGIEMDNKTLGVKTLKCSVAKSPAERIFRTQRTLTSLVGFWMEHVRGNPEAEGLWPVNTLDAMYAALKSCLTNAQTASNTNVANVIEYKDVPMDDTRRVFDVPNPDQPYNDYRIECARALAATQATCDAQNDTFRFVLDADNDVVFQVTILLKTQKGKEVDEFTISFDTGKFNRGVVRITSQSGQFVADHSEFPKSDQKWSVVDNEDDNSVSWLVRAQQCVLGFWVLYHFQNPLSNWKANIVKVDTAIATYDRLSELIAWRRQPPSHE